MEVYSEDSVNLGEIREIRLKKLFDDYWIRKISNTKNALGFRTSRDVELFLYAISDYMWRNGTRDIPLSEIGEKLQRYRIFNSDKSIYIRVLDEDIIIEEGSSPSIEPWVTFVYDEFMEYSIAKGILASLPENIEFPKLEQKINELLGIYEEFPNIEGVISYLCIMLVSDRSQLIWNTLIDRGKPWTLVIPRSINRLPFIGLHKSRLMFLENYPRWMMM